MSAGRISLAVPRGATGGVPSNYTFSVGQGALGRINGRWRKVKVISIEVDNINGQNLPVTVAAWQTEGTLILTRKRFVPTVDDDLMPDNKHTRLLLASRNETIVESIETPPLIRMQ